jgi:flagellar biogenesis protein FliO
LRTPSSNSVGSGNKTPQRNSARERTGCLSDQSTRSTVQLLTAILLSLLLISRCPAQTTAPAAPPPAVEGAYEKDSLHIADAGAATSVNSKTVAGPQISSPISLDIRHLALSLGIVLGLIFICRWAARWMFPGAAVGRSSQVMKILSRSVIAPKQQLLLIQVGRRLVVVGDCGQQMNALAEITDPDEVASLLGQLRAQPELPEAARPFAPLLGRARDEFGDLPVPPVTPPFASGNDHDEEENELAAAGVVETRGELTGLTEKIRMLSRQLGKM